MKLKIIFFSLIFSFSTFTYSQNFLDSNPPILGLKIGELSNLKCCPQYNDHSLCEQIFDINDHSFSIQFYNDIKPSYIQDLYIYKDQHNNINSIIINIKHSYEEFVFDLLFKHFGNPKVLNKQEGLPLYSYWENTLVKVIIFGSLSKNYNGFIFFTKND